MSDTQPKPEDFIIDDFEDTIRIDGIKFPKSVVLGMPNGTQIWEEGLAAKAREEAKATLRIEVNKNVGDRDSREGTLSDVLQIMVVIGLATVSAAKDGQSGFVTRLNERLAALAPQVEGQPSIHDMADQYLAGIASGDIRLTPALKGLGGVMTELITRQNATFDTLAAFIAEQQAAAAGGA